MGRNKSKPFIFGKTITTAEPGAVVYRVPDSYALLNISEIRVIPNSVVINNGGALVNWFQATDEKRTIDTGARSENIHGIISTDTNNGKYTPVFLGSKLPIKMQVPGGASFVVTCDLPSVADCRVQIVVVAEKVEK